MCSVNSKKIEEHSLTSHLFHSSLKEEIKKTQSQDIKNMFAPYLRLNDDEGAHWSNSPETFTQFLDTIIKAAKEAPNHIGSNYKTNLRNQHIAEWVFNMRNAWPDFTEISFGLGDWLVGLNDADDPDKKGIYKSQCADILYDLLSAIDVEIKKSDIETAMRKL